MTADELAWWLESEGHNYEDFFTEGSPQDAPDYSLRQRAILIALEVLDKYKEVVQSVQELERRGVSSLSLREVQALLNGSPFPRGSPLLPSGRRR